MRRKKPEVGDLVRVSVSTAPTKPWRSVADLTCLVTSTQGIHLWVQPLNRVLEPVYVRRDVVEVISRANSH
jgi:hypothetical protein